MRKCLRGRFQQASPARGGKVSKARDSTVCTSPNKPCIQSAAFIFEILPVRERPSNRNKNRLFIWITDRFGRQCFPRAIRVIYLLRRCAVAEKAGRATTN